MQIFVSILFESLEDIRITASEDETVIRQDLFEFYNDAFQDGGLPDGAPELSPNATTTAIKQAIHDWIGRAVVIEQTEVISRRGRVD